MGRYPPNNFRPLRHAWQRGRVVFGLVFDVLLPRAARADPTGPSTGALHVVRGGSWHSSAIFCRSAHRAAETSVAPQQSTSVFASCASEPSLRGRRLRQPSPTARAGPAPPPLVAPFKEEQIDRRRARRGSSYAQIDERADELCRTDNDVDSARRIPDGIDAGANRAASSRFDASTSKRSQPIANCRSTAFASPVRSISPPTR